MSFSFSRLAFPGWRYLATVVVVGAVGAYWYASSGGSLGATLTVARADFATQVSVSGSVVAAKDVDLGFAANGRVIGVYAVVGQHVAAGTLLAETENGDLAAAVAQKQAALAQARADLASLLAGTRPEEIAVSEAAVQSAKDALVAAVQSAYTTADDAVHNKADSLFVNPRVDPVLSFSVPNLSLETSVENERLVMESVLGTWATELTQITDANASLQAKDAQTALAKVTTLLADLGAVLNQAIPDQKASAATISTYSSSVATARTNVNTTASTLSADLAALISAQKDLVLKQAGPTNDAVAAEQAKVAAAQADVENAQAALGKTRVIAPFSGVVTRMNAKAGEIVSPSTSDISMQTDGVFQIETYVPEVSIAGVAAGDPATTTLDAYGLDVPFAAKVIAVDPAETMKDGVPTYKTTLTFLIADSRIRSGMTANVVITTGTLQNAIVIPAGAVGQDSVGSYVSVLVDKKVERRAVEVGPPPALGQVQVLSGLSTGDVILLAPAP